MFDNIGRDLDEEANRRRATSLLLTVGGSGAVLGLIVGIAAYLTVEVLTTEEKVIEIAMNEPPPEELSPLPQLPPPPLKGEPKNDAEATPPEPETPPETVRELPEKVDEQLASAEKPVGTDEGDINGDINGVTKGTPTGTSDGPGTGQGGVRVFHHSELEVKSRSMPDYPDAALQLSLGEQRCLVKVFIDENGVPYDASVDNCPSAFHAASRAAILKWRWYPPKDNKRRIRAQTTIAITYRL